jgi:hypothetical protein
VAARKTIVVHTRLAGHLARVEAARTGSSGVQIMTMGQLAARLAGGFLRPIDLDALRDAVRQAIATIDLGELEPIKNLPGMLRAAVGTLDKLWRAGIDLGEETHPRLEAMRALEEEVVRRLPSSMRRPKQLVESARARIAFAKTVLGPVEIHGHSEMSPCWRSLLKDLSEVVPVTWIAGPRHLPDWLQNTGVEIQTAPSTEAQPILLSCANPQHEVIEAFRWMRELLATGTARPEEIALTAASPADFDDHVLTLSRDANIPVHFVHGTNALASWEGQGAAALADVLVKGISQERVRRLFAIIHRNSPAMRDLPREWTRILPPDAPLTAIERWEQVFSKVRAEDWPNGIDRSGIVLDILRLLANGPRSAEEVGEQLLTGVARSLWRLALDDGPAEALPVTLSRLRSDDGLEPAVNVVFGSAMALASAPRPYVRLLALNAGRWPRQISEDRLIPDHVIPSAKLDPLPISDSDRRDFETIIGAAKAVTISCSRRDVEGRLLGRSPLISNLIEIYHGRARIPEHAASESDRLFARPIEFQGMPIAISGAACWRDWSSAEITPHDGLIKADHPRLKKVIDRPLSATSLRLLLRDPIRFLWRYGLGWKQPEEADDPLTADAVAFGVLVHDLLRRAVDALDAAGGIAKAQRAQVEFTIEQILKGIAREWESEQPVPPPLIWGSTLQRAKQMSLVALTHPVADIEGQRSWTEIPFGITDAGGRRLPWDGTRPVEIPSAGIRIRGNIDRLDLAGNMKKATVIDYKTGRLNRNMADVVVKGGSELQRCLYAFVVKSLLGTDVHVEAALLYPGVTEGEQALFPLTNVDGALDQLAAAIKLARDNLIYGAALPGVDANDQFNDFAFAYPASPVYLSRKMPLAKELLGEAAKIWDAP